MDHFGQAAQAVTLSYVLDSKHKEEGLLGEDSSPGLECRRALGDGGRETSGVDLTL